MLKALHHRLFAAAFAAWTTTIRARRLLFALGRPRLRRLDHVTIPVSDLDVASRFYCDILGGTHLMRPGGAALRRLARRPASDDGRDAYHLSLYLGGVTRIDLFFQRDGQPAPAAGHPHYAFRVTPRDLLRFQERLHAHGVPTEGPLRLGIPGQASLYFNDPAGNHLELTCDGFPRDIPSRRPVMSGLVWGPESTRR